MRKPYHIRERSPGRWAIIFSERTPGTYKRTRKWYSLKGTRKDAQIEAARLLTEREAVAVDPKKMRLSQFLEQWLDYIKPRVSPKSHERYSEIVTKNIVPLLGDAIISKLERTPRPRRADGETALEAFRPEPSTICTVF